MPVDRMEAFRTIIAEVGEVSAEQLCALMEQRFGIKMLPQFIPVFRACLREKEKASAHSFKPVASPQTVFADLP